MNFLILIDLHLELACRTRHLVTPPIAAVYPRWRMTENGLTPYETSGEPFSVPLHLASPGLIPCHHLTVMRRANVEAILSDVGAAHPVMVKSQEHLLTIGSLHYGRVVRHTAPWRCHVRELALLNLLSAASMTGALLTRMPERRFQVLDLLLAGHTEVVHDHVQSNRCNAVARYGGDGGRLVASRFDAPAAPQYRLLVVHRQQRVVGALGFA